MKIPKFIKSSIRRHICSFLDFDGSLSTDFPCLNRAVIEVNNIAELKKNFNWTADPNLDIPIIHEFNYSEDLNERRLHDAESLGTVARNINPSICVDIGTALGHSAALISLNAPRSTAYTVNIRPDELEAGKGGVLTTGAFSVEQIGSYYRERGLQNIQQVFANTATWEPDFGVIDLAFIDGCHDAEFVYNDTLKILKRMKSGSFILWHDFNLELAPKYNWIHSVCLGVEKLFQNGYLHGRVFHLRDSWTGIYQVNDLA